MGLTLKEKELKNKYVEVESGCKKGDSMYSCYSSEIYKVVALSENRHIDIPKFRIHTDFCYGYDGYTQQSEDRANEACRRVQTEPEYFIQSNLSMEYERYYKKLTLFDLYTGLQEQKGNFKVNYLVHAHRGCFPDVRGNQKEITRLTALDVEILLAALEESKQDYIKRLQTYLKKYGFSKLNVWTYWRD